MVKCMLCVLLSISMSLGEGEFTQSVWPGPVMSQANHRRSATLALSHSPPHDNSALYPSLLS